jgi:hypothetical protein
MPFNTGSSVCLSNGFRSMPKDKHRASSKGEPAANIAEDEQSTKRAKRLKKEDDSSTQPLPPPLPMQQDDFVADQLAAVLAPPETAGVRAEKKNKKDKKHKHSHYSPAPVESTASADAGAGGEDSKKKLKRLKKEDSAVNQQPLLPLSPPLLPSKPQSSSQAGAAPAPSLAAPLLEPVLKKEKRKQRGDVSDAVHSSRGNVASGSGQGALAADLLQASTGISHAATSHLKRKNRNKENTGNSNDAASALDDDLAYAPGADSDLIPLALSVRNRRAGGGSRSSAAASAAAADANNSAPQDSSTSSDRTLSEKQRIRQSKTKQPNPSQVVQSSAADAPPSASIPPAVIHSLRIHAVQNASLPSKGGFLQVENEILMAAMQVSQPHKWRNRAVAS